MKKKLLALVLAAAMTLSLASCGGSKTETPSTGSDNSSASSDNTSAEGATYKVGICQLVQHPALDAATQGFIDALNEALPGQVEFENKNASGEANNCGTIVNGFVSEGVDLIMANATAALTAAASATERELFAAFRQDGQKSAPDRCGQGKDGLWDLTPLPGRAAAPGHEVRSYWISCDHILPDRQGKVCRIPSAA